MSFEQFLLLLELSHTKLEWLDGIAYAIAGGSFEHSRLANRVGTLLTNALRGKPCVALQSDMLVKAPLEGESFAAFPGASVVCGEPVRAIADGKGFRQAAARASSSRPSA
ncbi:MAG TPA: Uma2 family endonuclease [Labilithrix sp.]|nr:Uma2 family endonuclease [Labilithrix sp.]